MGDEIQEDHKRDGEMILGRKIQARVINLIVDDDDDDEITKPLHEKKYRRN